MRGLGHYYPSYYPFHYLGQRIRSTLPISSTPQRAWAVQIYPSLHLLLIRTHRMPLVRKQVLWASVHQQKRCEQYITPISFNSGTVSVHGLEVGKWVYQSLVLGVLI